jgi:hypothetical protein
MPRFKGGRRMPFQMRVFSFPENCTCLTPLKDFRQFTLEGQKIVISFSDPAIETDTETLPPLRNKNLASEPVYLQSLQVGYLFSCTVLC